MKTYKKEIEGVDVWFVKMGDMIGWFCYVDSKEFSAYIKVESVSDDRAEQHFKVLEDNARNSIKAITK